MYSSLTVGRKNKTFFEKIPKILDFTPKMMYNIIRKGLRILKNERDGSK